MKRNWLSITKGNSCVSVATECSAMGVMYGYIETALLSEDELQIFTDVNMKFCCNRCCNSCSGIYFNFGGPETAGPENYRQKTGRVGPKK